MILLRNGKYSNEVNLKWKILDHRIFAPPFLRFTLMIMMVVMMMMMLMLLLLLLLLLLLFLSQDFQPAAIFLELDREDFYHLRSCRRNQRLWAWSFGTNNKSNLGTTGLSLITLNVLYESVAMGFGLAISSPVLVQTGTCKGQKALG